MKIRSGFVSNSSSSSFVLLGAKLKGVAISDEMKMKMLDDIGRTYDKTDADDIDDCFGCALYGGAFELRNPGETDAWGKILVEGDDCELLEASEYSFEELAEQAKVIKQKIKDMFGIDADIKLITGTYFC